PLRVAIDVIGSGFGCLASDFVRVLGRGVSANVDVDLTTFRAAFSWRPDVIGQRRIRDRDRDTDPAKLRIESIHGRGIGCISLSRRTTARLLSVLFFVEFLERTLASTIADLFLDAFA